MRTLGVDLAAQPKKTAACTIEWDTDSATVSDVTLNLTNRDIVALANDRNAIGIDAPFGWPMPFVDFIRQTDAPPMPKVFLDLDQLCFRRTDLYIKRKYNHQPLSVACDKLAKPAMRCVDLLSLLGVTDRSGVGRVYEVYPAIALRVWGFAFKGFKPRKLDPQLGNPNLAALLRALRDACPWLQMSDTVARRCERNHDAFDALVASLVTRAAALGLTERPTGDDAAIATVEGWIAVPEPKPLATLLDPRST